MAAADVGEDTLRCKEIEAAEGSVRLQFGEGHSEQLLGTLDIHTCEVEHHALVALKQRHQLFP